MSGYGGADDESVNVLAMAENAIDLARSRIPKGVGTLVCSDCGDPIPAARKLAMPGCRYCVTCQEEHDRLPKFKLVTQML